MHSPEQEQPIVPEAVCDLDAMKIDNLFKMAQEAKAFRAVTPEGLVNLALIIELRKLIPTEKEVVKPYLAVTEDKNVLVHFIYKVMLGLDSGAHVYLFAPAKQEIRGLINSGANAILKRYRESKLFQSRHALNRFGFCTLEQLLEADSDAPGGIDPFIWQCAQTFKREKQTIADIAKS